LALNKNRQKPTKDSVIKPVSAPIREVAAQEENPENTEADVSEQESKELKK
jgi:hypothetical protein